MLAILTALLLAGATASADVSVAGGGVPARWAPCVAAVQAALRPAYDFVPQSDEHFCDVTVARSGFTVECHKTCIDRSCHNDACELWDEDLAVRVEERVGAASAWWHRLGDYEIWRWERQYGGGVHATVETRGSLGRMRRALDACVARR